MYFPKYHRQVLGRWTIQIGSLMAIILGIMFTLPASAQTFAVGAGTKDGTYDRQLTEIRRFCDSELVLSPVPSNGAVKNAEMLTANEISGGWVQADVLHMMAKNQDMGNIKTLFVLNPEQLHFVVKADLSVKTGGTLGLGGTTVRIEEVTQIGGMRLAAAGGGLWTAKQVRLDGEIPYNIVEVGDSKAAVAALGKTADVALVVGGAPMDFLKTLGPDYRLLRAPEALQKKLSGIYNPDRVTYSGMNASGVSTVSVQSLFVVREYKTAKMRQALASLKSCVLGKLDEIKETTGTHPSWQKVSAESQSQAKWPLYQLPSAGKK